MRTFVLAALLILPILPATAGEQTGTVRMDHGQWGSGANSPGYTFFVLDGAAKSNTPACNTYISRWVINNAWPAARLQMAILLAAISSGKTVTVRGSGDCAQYSDSETAVDIRLNN